MVFLCWDSGGGAGTPCCSWVLQVLPSHHQDMRPGGQVPQVLCKFPFTAGLRPLHGVSPRSRPSVSLPAASGTTQRMTWSEPPQAVVALNHLWLWLPQIRHLSPGLFQATAPPPHVPLHPCPQHGPALPPPSHTHSPLQGNRIVGGDPSAPTASSLLGPALAVRGPPSPCRGSFLLCLMVKDHASFQGGPCMSPKTRQSLLSPG